ncbi:MAG: Purine nucleoside phosphorylase [uncultured Gemmatimonadaceae bacterium]|uniref:Purine nucleoside phosphorylase n=1 Tax=uncultured Gemmatimonadaceae bacterium TaxID=246130 RepID=A0A6J4M6G2_9BACT|nr:MAG: Purine nucleoside phosphorylase [uncultured Gemmatimonadaceae bacterium]
MTARDDAPDLHPHGAAAAERAADAVRARAPHAQSPAAALILGSGLGGIADRIEAAERIPFADVPGFAAATVVGHRGELIAGRLAGKPVVALAGRFHLYEGHDAALAGFPVRVLHALGARTLFVSNAAGGIRRTFRAGDLMLIADHLNLMWRNPLVGALVPGDVRFPDMSEPYSRELAELVRAAARDAGVPLQEGVYAGLLGPSYETPAEVRMLDRLGADAVGMSTVPEVVVAEALGMRVAGVSCITNLAAGISATPLSHAEVIETTQRVAARFEALVTGFVSRL